jgi:hypothetical protein
MAALQEKDNMEVSRIETVPDTSSEPENMKRDDGKMKTDEDGFVTDMDNLGKGYYLSPFFLGSTCAIGMLGLFYHSLLTSRFTSVSLPLISLVMLD